MCEVFRPESLRGSVLRWLWFLALCGVGISGVEHSLEDAAPCIDEPVVDLQDGETSLLGDNLLLILSGIRVLKNEEDLSK